MSLFYRIVRAVIRLLGRLLFRVEAYGVDNVPKTGGYLLVANHASNLDPPLIAISIPRACHTLAKRELFDVPVIGWAIRRLYSHPIDRGGVDRRALKECIDVLREGNLLLLFPEGTRTANGELQNAKAGAAMIAIQAGVPFIPVYVEGTYDALPRGRSWPRLSKVRIFFGQPCDPHKIVEDVADKREAYNRLAAAMMAKIAELRPSTDRHPALSNGE